MKLKLFYSWQAQTREKFNRYFILECIKQAVKDLKTDPETKDLDITILEGTNMEPGVTPPAEVIMEDRIPNCDIFIADLSIVNKLPESIVDIMKEQGHIHRLVPNTNVMIEFGIAHKWLGKKKIIFVMNNEYGSPKDNVEIIPFDIRSYRWPIEFKYNDASVAAKVKKSLIASLAGAVKETALYSVQNKQLKYRPFLRWSKWTEVLPQAQPYASNEKLHLITTEIKNALLKDKTNIRFLGLPGLGKTRITHEIFRPIAGDADSELLSSRVLYVDANRNDSDKILARIEDIVNEGSEYIIILDNCRLTLFREAVLLTNSTNSRNSLITISPDPEEYVNNKISGISYHLLKKDDLVSVVDQILERDFGNLPPENIAKIKEFAQGIPMMAVLLGESAVDGEEFIGKLGDKELLNKLLGEHAIDGENRRLLQTSALFNYFGFDDEVNAEFRFLAGNRELTVTDHSPQKSEDIFRQLVNHYLKREIYEQKGRYIGMRPFPLALSLAVEWLENCTSDRLLRVITAIAKLENPHRTRLATAFSDQMKYLGYNEKAVKILNQITGPGSPFDNAEVLNTELGSRFFRSFVEVVPVSVSDNLYRNFAFKTISELEKVVQGRRNLIWVLENLCFGKETFNKSVRVLFAFAVAENETWGNNATGQLMQLFSAHLAGTEVNLCTRVDIIKWGLSHPEKRYRELAVKAIGRGLTFIHSHRVLGAENQGMITRKDYVPSHEEIQEYWDILLELLKNIILTQPELESAATEIFSNSIREIVYVGNGRLLISHLNEIADFRGNDWNHALDNLVLTLRFESNIPEDLHKDLSDVIRRLNKKDFKSKYIRALDYKIEILADEVFSYEKFQKYTEDLARDFLNSGLNWKETIPMFYHGKQYHVFYFGKGIADELRERSAELRRFIDISLAALDDIDRADQDGNVLGAIFRFSDGDIQQYIKREVKSYPKLSYLLFYLTSLENDSYANTDELFKLIDSGEFELSEFIQFRANGPLKVDEGIVIKFCHKLFNYGHEGYKVAYQIVFGMTYLNEDKSTELIQILKECVLNLGILNQSLNVQDYHQWWETIRLILKQEKESNFASLVNEAIIDSISLKNSYHLDNSMQRIYETLITRHFNKIWPKLSQSLILQNENYIKFYGLKHILGSGISPVKRPEGVLFDGDIDQIFKWCEENPTIAPARLAELVPVFATRTEGDKFSWHPYAKRLIDGFGEYEAVLSSLSANINTYFWTGSIVPYLKQQLDLMDSLIFHPNAKVSEWATKYHDYLELEIVRQKKRDQEDLIM
ncbi:hypothetical protein [Chryseobacterium sp. SIMBA_029]|uniref:hypothetical protein n=1 Tax=Chryseobacterium sp. SIMBA_029 TaxID=3085772 RepID=UPI00397B336C